MHEENLLLEYDKDIIELYLFVTKSKQIVGNVSNLQIGYNSR